MCREIQEGQLSMMNYFKAARQVPRFHMYASEQHCFQPLDTRRILRQKMLPELHQSY